MVLAPWRSPLARALHHNRSLPNSRYLQLATVRENGKPANQTIVFRGFLAETDQLKFVTDAQSEKAEQISQKPWGEACWYFPKTREQFRLSGQLILIAENHADPTLEKARQSMWQELSDAARSQFAWPHPGKLREDDRVRDLVSPTPKQPVSHFCLLLLIPNRVDHLELRGTPQNRWLYQRDNDTWTTKSINP